MKVSSNNNSVYKIKLRGEILEMKVVVITGSSRGIGYGLADSFLDLGCAVTVSGNKHESTNDAVGKLTNKHNDAKVLGHPCDVKDMQALQSVWDAAVNCFGKVDIWINNAGISHASKEIWKLDPEAVEKVIQTTLLGAVYGSMVAVRGMLVQGFGSLYNMGGMGSDGRKHTGLTIYGMTKYGLQYFTESLAKETRGTSLIVGSIRPGMVATDMLKEGYRDRPDEWERDKRIFNLIADRVETVTPWLAKQILSNRKTGATISWMTKRKMLMRMMSILFKKRELFD